MPDAAVAGAEADSDTAAVVVAVVDVVVALGFFRVRKQPVRANEKAKTPKSPENKAFEMILDWRALGFITFFMKVF